MCAVLGMRRQHHLGNDVSITLAMTHSPSAVRARKQKRIQRRKASLWPGSGSCRAGSRWWQKGEKGEWQKGRKAERQKGREAELTVGKKKS